MMTTTLHIHGLMLDHGALQVQFGSNTGRPVTMTIDPEDHPALKEAYERFTETLCLAGEQVMLDLIGGAIPDTPEPARRRRMCRICDVTVTEGDPGSRFDGESAYCATHA